MLLTECYGESATAERHADRERLRCRGGLELKPVELLRALPVPAKVRASFPSKSKSFIRLLNASLELAYDVASAATLFIPVVNCM